MQHYFAALDGQRFLLKAITEFSHSIPESQTKTIHTWKNSPVNRKNWVIKYNFFFCRLKHLVRTALNVSERNGSEVKQAECRHQDGQKAKLLLHLSLTEKSTSYGTCSCQAEFKNWASHSTSVWVRCSWIVINMHCRITKEHGRSTLEN